MRAPYRIWWIPQIPGKPIKVEVPDLKTAQLMLNTLAEYDLFQYENRIKPDYSNAGGIQRWDENENDWIDVKEEDY